MEELPFTSCGRATGVPAFLSAAPGEVGISSLPLSCSCFWQKPMSCCHLLFSFSMLVPQEGSGTNNMPRGITFWDFYFLSPRWWQDDGSRRKDPIASVMLRQLLAEPSPHACCAAAVG